MFFGIFNSIMMIYFTAAVLPAIILLVIIYKQDKVEKEPVGMIIGLLGFGVLAAFCSMIAESAGQWLLPKFVSTHSQYYKIIFAFLVVAVVEEGFKFLFLKKRTWNDPNFNYRFDGVVYAVAVSLGFAAIENLQYVMGYGLSVATSRALLAIPGHLSFSVFMGTFYGNAKLQAARGNHGRAKFCLFLAYFSAVFFHGFYDSCLMVNTNNSMTLFVTFVIAMYIFVFFLVRHDSKTDRPL
ncbi:PrsW family intramembrane metalloprotease [Aminicella lysinilytica]|uniref:Protease PrsW n=2 Tax=Aminicella lysinilytica TaxID=433323 RepID=A0A4R6Q2G4_9FIRM|nr:PrsW family intramembrane metalloprotease [Aminicella lysinilytica]TDP56371.1 RsiW-degrading membrane proteinase PrsW (M82 family) [Aminicella lysinilytica]